MPFFALVILCWFVGNAEEDIIETDCLSLKNSNICQHETSCMWNSSDLKCHKDSTCFQKIKTSTTCRNGCAYSATLIYPYGICFNDTYHFGASSGGNQSCSWYDWVQWGGDCDGSSCSKYSGQLCLETDLDQTPEEEEEGGGTEETPSRKNSTVLIIVIIVVSVVVVGTIIVLVLVIAILIKRKKNRTAHRFSPMMENGINGSPESATAMQSYQPPTVQSYQPSTVQQASPPPGYFLSQGQEYPPPQLWQHPLLQQQMQQQQLQQQGSSLLSLPAPIPALHPDQEYPPQLPGQPQPLNSHGLRQPVDPLPHQQTYAQAFSLTQQPQPQPRTQAQAQAQAQAQPGYYLAQQQTYPDPAQQSQPRQGHPPLY